jgi:ribosomal protein L14
MLKVGSYAFCIDVSGVYFVKIFKVFGGSRKKQITIGKMVMVVVKSVNTNTHFLKDDKMKLKFNKGSIHRAIVVHTIAKYKRSNRTYI